MNFVDYFNKHYIKIKIDIIKIVEINIHENLLFLHLTFFACIKSIANNI